MATWVALQPKGPAHAPPVVIRDKRIGDDDTRASRWVCATCKARMASRHHELAVDGQVRHQKVNPAGFLLSFMTLQVCQCAAVMHAPTASFSWFPPHPWQFTVCVVCQTHLGWAWLELPGRPGFFGVLLERALLVEDGPAGAT